MPKLSPVPATILTGFLGSGKTTLLNRILGEQHGYRFGIIINELGAIGIDDQLVETADEEVMLMRNGCVCCTVRKDLVEGIQKLLMRYEFDYLLIETTGIADPAPIAQTFYNFPSLSPYVRLDSIVTLVDAEHVDQQVREAKVCVKQIATADFILLNKVDLSNEADLARIERSIRRINPHAAIYRSEHSAVSLHHILDVNVFNIEDKIAADPKFLEELHLHGHEAISAVSLRVSGLLDPFRFQTFMGCVGLANKVFRSKGILAIAGSPRRAVFHGVNNRFTIFWDRLWRQHEVRESQLVFIGKNLQRESIESGVQGCVLRELTRNTAVGN